MSDLQVILLNDLPNLGKLGDVIKVKRGYARNHLLPSSKAQTYTKENWIHFEKIKDEIIAKQQATRASLEKLHGDLDGYMLQEVMHASDDGHLYGSITQALVVDLLKKQNYDIKRNQVTLPNNVPIKRLGEYEIQIKITLDLVSTLKLSVLGEN